MQTARYALRTAAATNVVSRRFGGETLLVPVCAGVGDLDSVYTLNEVATAIWEALNEPIAVTALADRVAAEYEVSPENAVTDVESCLRDLENLGMVTFSTTAKTGG